jgi:putative oxidoreductase
MEPAKRWAPLIGRILLSLIFVMSGLQKITAWDQTAGYMAAKHMPVVPLFLTGAIALEVLGGLSVLTGFRARLGALALIVFLIPTTLIFHNFWAYTGQEQQMQMINFMKNLAILGGLFVVAGLGAGGLSLDSRSAD